jgi:hypothetical protein
MPLTSTFVVSHRPIARITIEGTVHDLGLADYV